jgi:hypothetical protein
MNDSSENKMKTTVPSGDPVLDQHQYGTWMTIPYVFKNISRGERNSFYQAVQEFSMPEDSGFKCNAPEAQLRREQLDRWLLKEPRALFRQDEDDIFQETPYNSPRMKWISWNKSEWQFPNESTEHGFRLAMLNSKQKSMRPFPNEMQFDAFSLLSNEGVLLLVIRILPPKEGGISLQKAMDLNYDLAHSGNFGNIPVLVPNKLFDRSVNEQLGETGECLFSDRQVSQCLKLWPHEKHGQDPLLEINESDNEMSWGKKEDAQPVILQSFQELMKQKIVDALSKEYGKPLQTYQASRGRTNLFTRFLLPKNTFELYERSTIENLESMCARCMRHPSTSNIIPLSTEKLQGEEFKTIHVTGDHRVHLSCESILSFGQDLTDYPQDWKSRWGTDYFLCFLIAYHQSILCQELSWSSFKKSSERDLGELNERFINYCTYYDFSLISNQLNHQKIYRVAREVLGVPGITEEVGEEIKARLDTQRNEQQQRFNESQANFNSLAVLFFLLGCTTFLLNLNLKPFSSDAEITWDFSEGMESLLLWVPVGITFLLLLIPKIRNHIWRVMKLLFKKE